MFAKSAENNQLNMSNNSDMKSLIIGGGEVGMALYKVLKPHYEVYIQDKTPQSHISCEVLHICFPYSKDFVGDVKDYIEMYRPHYTVIHSTVPVGTCRECQAFHSPVRGVHPHLAKSLKTFVKYLAPPDNFLKRYFEKAGIKIKLIDKPENTEALKIWSTTQYGMFLILEKEINRFCEENGLDPKIVYTDANKTYNEGYVKLGMKNVVRPVLRHYKGGIGGHCVIQNCDLLKHPITDFIKKQNKTCV
jgi:hypothetical protein